MSVNIVFPGQGSQYVGMGKKFLNDPIVKETFDEADDTLNFSISSLCLEGPEEKLIQTEFTQPAIVTYSVALFRKLKNILSDKNIIIDIVAGHSVGEYAALTAAGVLDFKDAVTAVHLRGKYMQEAVPLGLGAMYAILRLSQEQVELACKNASTDTEKVMPANFNDPGQIVISGHKEACERAVSWLKENIEDRHMAIPLKVSAPFHSSLMLPAEKKLEAFLNTLTFNTSELSYIANIDAKKYIKGTPGNIAKTNLIEQVCGSVLWTQSMQTLSDNSKILECGPGKVLTGLNKKINKTFNLHTLDTDDGFESLEGFLL